MHIDFPIFDQVHLPGDSIDFLNQAREKIPLFKVYSAPQADFEQLCSTASKNETSFLNP
jgi:hypothetical protein